MNYCELLRVRSKDFERIEKKIRIVSILHLQNMPKRALILTVIKVTIAVS